MAKAVILGYVDGNLGADDNNIFLLAKVMFVGATVPGGLIVDMGPNENGLPIAWNINGTEAAFSNNCESALAARATALGFTINATDVLIPRYLRGT